MPGLFSVLCTQRLPPKSGCLKSSGNLTLCGSLSTATISTFEIQQISSMPFKVSINHLLPPANEVCVHRCLSVHNGGCLPLVLGDVCHPLPRQIPPWANPRADTLSPGQTPPWADTPPTPGQTPPLSSAGIHTHPPSLVDTTGYGQQAGGTHPTGMHSCFILLIQNTCKLGYQN